MTGGEGLLGVIFGTCRCTAVFDCELDIDNYGILLWFILMAYMFKALGTICDEYFVPALEGIVERLQISNDVAGATFMAAGSSAPELFTALVSTFIFVSEGGVGTIIGSAIFNIFVIVGVTGFIACKDNVLDIWWYPLSRDSAFYFVAIIELLIVLWDETVEWYEALIMVMSYLVYILYMKFNEHIIRLLKLERPGEVEKLITTVDTTDSTKDPDALRNSGDGAGPPGQPAHHLGLTSEPPPTIAAINANVVGKVEGEVRLSTLAVPEMSADEKDRQRKGSKNSTGSGRPRLSLHDYNEEEQAREQDKRRISASEQANRTSSSGGVPAIHVMSAESASGSMCADVGGKAEEDCESSVRPWWKYCKDPLNLFWELTLPSAENHPWILFFASILYIGLATFIMVDATGRMGCILTIDPFIMGCTFLAAGTSIPDALGSIAVAKQGEGDMAVANALGSNVFDIMLGLGVPWLIATAVGRKVHFPGAKDELTRGIFILVGVLIVFVGSLIVNKWALSRRMGMLLIFFYMLFAIYNVVLWASSSW